MINFIAFIILILATTSFLIAKYIVYNRKRTLEESIKEYGYAYDLSAYKKSPFSIKNQRREIIYGEFYSIDNPKGLMIICHGFSCNRVFSYKYAKMFLSLNFDVLVYDHTHSGESEGNCCGMGYYESEDLEEIVNYFKNNYSYKVTGTHGESMGAATVLKHLGKFNSVDFTIADCSYETLSKQIKSRINKLIKLPGIILLPMVDVFLQLIGGYKFADLNIKESVVNIKRPFMLVHGSADSYIPVEDSLNLKLLNDNCQKIFICNGADHARSYDTDPELYKNEVIEFLESISKL